MDIRDVLVQVLSDGLGSHEKRSEEEMHRRVRSIGRLFRAFSEQDARRAEFYLDETLAIPLDKLEAAVTALIRANVWHRLPVLGEVWRAARTVAGMHREQYNAGHYLPAPREWPPDGTRHAICAGSYEPIACGAGLLALAPLADAPRLEAGGDE